MSRKHARRPSYVLAANGQIIPRDNSPHECWLVIERETPGGAYVVWPNGEPERQLTVPMKLLTIEERFGPPFIATNWRTSPPSMLRAQCCYVSGPGFIFDEKGLR